MSLSSPEFEIGPLTCPKISPSKCYGISATNPGFTSESGGELRQHLVFGLKVGYALSRGVQHSMREWPHEKEQCMKTFAFERWCDRLQLPTATRDFLLRLRSSPPVRQVQGRLLNVCGTYASRKMGVSIQFESHTVELWAIYTMEYDREVLEFFDQPYQLELHYQGPSGRPTKALHTPDFLVLRKDGASFEEWKPEEKLLELMVTHPGRYQRDERGKWRCAPGEAAAESLGLSYRVRSSEELHPGYIRNLIFLEEYFFDCVVPNGALAHILEAVEATPGITLSALREQDEHLRVDHVYALITRNRLYVDLYTFWLKDQLHLPLYLDRPTAEAHALLRNSQRNAPFGFGDGGNLTLSANALLDWDGKRWTLLNLGKTTTTLLPEEGTLIQLETPVFLHLIDTHVIQVKDTSQSPTMALSAEVHRLLIEAGDKALEVANQRYLLGEAYQNKQQEIYVGTPTRTIRDWLTNFRDAEAAYGYGYGYVGLLPKTAARGNREPKVTEERRRLLDEAIAHWYVRPKQQKVRDVFVLYQRTCLEQHIQRDVYEEELRRLRLRAVLLDEAQHLITSGDGKQPKDQLNWIKSMAIETGVLYVIYNLERSGRLLNNWHYVYSELVSDVLFQRSRARLYIMHVLIGTYDLLPFCNLDGQMIGRSLDIHFPRYRSTEKDLSQFKNVLRTFQDALPFVEETDILLKHWEFCYERSIGCVGNLRLMLVRAVHAALWANAKTS